MFLFKILPILIIAFEAGAAPSNSSVNDTREAVRLFMNETNMFLSKPSYPDFQECDVKFFLVTKEVSLPVELQDSDLELVAKDKPTVVIVPGWLQGLGDEMFTLLTNAYLTKGDYNIIQVDSSKYMFFPQPVSRTYAKPIGTAIGDFIVKLYRKKKVCMKTVHIIEHSLGCQITAYTAQQVTRQTGTKVYRITALDVGITTYLAASIPERLSKDNAVVVDVVHTTGGLIGIEEPIGSVDFYPNGGTYTTLQPGCKPIPIDSLTKYNPVELSTAFCSHHKSYIYFAYSINVSNITATKCSSYEKYEKGKCKNHTKAIFGENYVPGLPGTFYFNINCTESAECMYDY